MPRYRVRGTDKETGVEKTIEVIADTEKAAIEDAGNQGLRADGVEQMPLPAIEGDLSTKAAPRETESPGEMHWRRIAFWVRYWSILGIIFLVCDMSTAKRGGIALVVSIYTILMLIFEAVRREMSKPDLS